jgi:hypothetical protein
MPDSGELSWRLSSHPITLLCFLAFRICMFQLYFYGCLFIILEVATDTGVIASLAVYILGFFFTKNSYDAS